MNKASEKLRILLPSSGSLADGAISFMSKKGINIEKESDRKLVGKVKEFPDVEIFFQRSGDIPLSVDRGMGHFGITGLDRYLENCEGSRNSYVVKDSLKFGDSKLVVAVPDGWIDVTSISDLVEVCYEFKQNNNNLRLATKYPNIVRRKLEEFGVTNVVLVTASGGLEAAPMIGYADIIADITVTGTTMKENNLRPLLDGVLFDSQAAFISSNDIPSKLKKTSEQIIKKINL
ncbi:MAG: ATP phosphoribosyltransferase [Dehalococcoidia bacterium]|nr:ATP phosphoribosyltransferase [Dehalococcoidia bacterium]|tara:strand:+ start:4730 stop:5425 length:696 start_codon:yes stop_codon:yes gene_type:complete